MKKGTYYALCREYDTTPNNYVLVEKSGFIDSDNNIAINKEDGQWCATDLNTGLICTSPCKTKRECIAWYYENKEKIDRLINSDTIKPLRQRYQAMLKEKLGGDK